MASPRRPSFVEQEGRESSPGCSYSSELRRMNAGDVRLVTLGNDARGWRNLAAGRDCGSANSGGSLGGDLHHGEVGLWVCRRKPFPLVGSARRLGPTAGG
jgi:hypothetical protein